MAFFSKAAGPAAILLLAMMALHGCDLSGFVCTFYLYILIEAAPYCAITYQSNYLNSTEAQQSFMDCYQEKDGQVENATNCCALLEVRKVVPKSDAYCCNIETYNKMVNESTNEECGVDDEVVAPIAVEFCHNFTKNESKQIDEGVKYNCAPVTTKRLTSDSTFNSPEAFRAFAAHKTSEDKQSLQVLSRNFGKIMATGQKASSMPAYLAGIFLLAGAVAALLTYGGMSLTKRSSANRNDVTIQGRLLA